MKTNSSIATGETSHIVKHFITYTFMKNRTNCGKTVKKKSLCTKHRKQCIVPIDIFPFDDLPMAKSKEEFTNICCMKLFLYCYCYVIVAKNPYIAVGISLSFKLHSVF